MIYIKGFLLLLFLVAPGLCRADLIVTMAPSSSVYKVGDVASVSVFIHSNVTNTELDSYLISLNINGGAGVKFKSPQSETYLQDSLYVFEGRSANVALNLPATSVSNEGKTLTAADVSWDFDSNPAGAPLPKLIPGSSSPLLLGRFFFDVISPGSFTLTFDSNSTFSDVDFNTINFSSNSASFSAVPEPSSMVLLFLSGSVIAYRSRKRLNCKK